MIPLLIRRTLGCNYQSWWEEDEEGDEGELSFSLSSSLPFLRFVSQRRRGIDSY